MTLPTQRSPRLLDDELTLLAELVPLAGQQVIELGCGAARLARALLARHPDSQVTCLEVDARQHAKNLRTPQTGLNFVAAGAEAIPAADQRFDLALMLKSLHHVPVPLMATALREIARVLRPGAHLYVSEPVYDGALNEITRLYNDEGAVRAVAQTTLDEALTTGAWTQVTACRFDTPVSFVDFADFEQRMMRPTYADHQLDDTMIAAVCARFAPHCGPDGAQFTRPMRVRLLRRS
jgi:SAM-dependent methyltransferase